AGSGEQISETTLRVYYVVPRIDRVSPTDGWAPMALDPGTQIGLTGAHFAPGMSVQFGNPYAQASPTSISSDGTTLYVDVPRLAPDGPLSLIPQTGYAIAESATRFTVHNFRNTDGFAFQNLGVSNAHFDYADDVELFGYLGTTIDNFLFPVPNVF